MKAFLRRKIPSLVAALSLLCAAASAAPADFTFVVFPDTQYMVSSDLRHDRDVPMWKSMCEWVVANRGAQNIRAVLSVGDVTDHADPAEFGVASAGYRLLEAAGIPCVPIVGNHDYDLGPGNGTGYGARNRKVNAFDAAFGPARFTGKSWYGGSLDDSDANYYVTIEAEGSRFLVVALELFARPRAVEWAAQVIDDHPGADVIILTHGYMQPNGTLIKRWQSGGPGIYGLEDGCDGEELWDRLVRRKPRTIAVICGHRSGPPHVAHRTDTGDRGNAVHGVLFDYQGANRGDGWVGLLRFRPSLRTIEVSSYRTYAPSGLGGDPEAPAVTLPWAAGTVP
jgi:hypothetical protein